MKDKKKADFEFEYRRNGENGPDRGKCAESQDFSITSPSSWPARENCSIPPNDGTTCPHYHPLTHTRARRIDEAS